MDKRGQLGVIEAKYFFFGFISGLILGSVLLKLGELKKLPWGISIPFMCGFWNKKGQLIQLEWHFFWIGGLIGMATSWVLVVLSRTKVIPVDLSFLC